jgi:hypothetical protein
MYHPSPSVRQPTATRVTRQACASHLRPYIFHAAALPDVWGLRYFLDYPIIQILTWGRQARLGVIDARSREQA